MLNLPSLVDRNTSDVTVLNTHGVSTPVVSGVGYYVQMTSKRQAGHDI